MTKRLAFTLIELVTVIVILGILAAVAMPAYLDYRVDAKKSACKGALGGMRAGIANFYASSVTESGGGTPAYPTIAQLQTVGAVLIDLVPDNPFDTDSVKNNVETGTTRGTIVGSNGGWAYDPATGQIWANTNTSGIAENNF